MIIGIYKIENIKNGKIYVGSSKDIEKRWKEHIHKLKYGVHHSVKLQRSYDRIEDKSVFKFEVIEETTEDMLKEREQYYIDLYDSFNTGYNCCAEVDNPKYNLTNVKKANKAKQLNIFYDKFMTLYGQYQDSFEFGSTFLDRLSEKHYKLPVYKSTVGIIKWFLENYNPDEYIGRFSVHGNQQYFLVVGDKDGNEFACYKWQKNKMHNSHQDTELYRSYIKSKGLLDIKKHYIVDVPTLY